MMDGMMPILKRSVKFCALVSMYEMKPYLHRDHGMAI